MEEETRSDSTESTMSHDDSARLSTCSTLAGEVENSGKPDMRGGFMVPCKSDMAKLASNYASTPPGADDHRC